MKRIILYASSILALLAAGHESPAGWGPSGCAVVQIAPRVVAQVQEKWFPHEGHPNHILLYRGPTLIGGYNYADGFYRTWNGREWSRPAKAPIPPPFGGLAGEKTGHAFGMVPDQVGQFGMVSFNGEQITEADARDILGANLRDDTGAGSITYVDADKSRRESFVKHVDAEKKKNPRLENVKVQAYDPAAAPTRAMLAPFLLESDQKFRAGGKVLYAQHAPRPGEVSSKTKTTYGDATPEVIVDALRVIDPNWKPDLPALPSLPSIPDGLGLLLAAGFVMFGLVAVAVSNRGNP